MTRRVFNLHKGQKEVFRFKSRFKVIVAGRRWGKSKLAGISLVTAASRPKSLVWYVAPTYSMCKSIMWPDLIEIIPPQWIKKSNETTQSIQLINGSRIELKGCDKPDSLRGVGLHYLVIDEAQDIKKETWTTVLRPTLSDKEGNALIIGTPKGFNWLYDVYQEGQKKENRDKGLWASWQFPTITSPFIPPEEIASARRDMDERVFRQEFEASFETMSGRVYYPFDRKIHVSNIYNFDPRKPIYIGMDFNVTPMTAVVMQPQRNGELWAVDEIVLHNSSTAEMADEIERKYWRYMSQIYLFPDPASNYRNSSRGESDIDILNEKGFTKIYFHKKHPSVQDRINAVNKMLKSADGTVRLFINEKCTHLIESFEQTLYKENSKEVDKSQNKEHITDACGYCIEYTNPIRNNLNIAVSI